MSRAGSARANGRTRRARTATAPRSLLMPCRCSARAPARASRAQSPLAAPSRPKKPPRQPRNPPASSTTWKTTSRSEGLYRQIISDIIAAHADLRIPLRRLRSPGRAPAEGGGSAPHVRPRLWQARVPQAVERRGLSAEGHGLVRDGLQRRGQEVRRQEERQQDRNEVRFEAG